MEFIVMPLRIAVTVCDCADVVHVGGEPHRVTSIIELTDEQVPENLRRYFRDVATAKEHKEKYGSGGYVYQSVTLSLVE
jgi:uridine phosphorylase